MSQMPYLLQRRAIISLIIIGNILLLAFGLGSYFSERARAHAAADTMAQQVSRVLQNEITTSINALQTLSPMVKEAKGDIAKTRTLINNHITRAGKNLRIAWSDASMHLRIGTTIGVFEKDKHHASSLMAKDQSLDLSFRDYIQDAAKRPGEIVYGTVRPHLITGRPFFAVAMGVTNDKGKYLGCLASILDIENLRVLLDSIVATAPVQFIISLENGDRFYSHEEQEPSSDPRSLKEKGFTISYAVLNRAHETLMVETLQQFALWFFCVNLVLGVSLALVYRHYIRPLSELAATFLTLPRHLLPNLPEGSDGVTGVVNRARAIKNQLLHYHLNRSESQESLGNLKEAIQQIHSLHDEQVEFLRTLSAEMEATFSAISRYAGFVEGGLSEDYFHTDEVFLENLKDSAQNLKFLSNAFYLMCLHKSGNYVATPETVDVHPLVLQVTALFQAAADFREMTITIEADDETRIAGDSAVLRHIFWGMVYLLMHFVDDGAKITLSIRKSRTNPSGLAISAHASNCLPGLVNEADPDLAAFFPDSLGKPAQLHAAIARHVDWQVVDYLVRHFCEGSHIDIQTELSKNSALGFRLVLELAANLPPAHQPAPTKPETSTER